MSSRPFRPLGFAHVCRSRPAAPLYLARSRSARPLPRGFTGHVANPSRSIHSLLPSSLYLDHSHCPVLAPATLAALPSTRAIETRSLPTSLAATHRGFAFYVAFPESSIPDRDVFYVADPIQLHCVDPR
jgi:hypothetical protein